MKKLESGDVRMDAYGRMAIVLALAGRPLLDEARLLTSWCTAALAIP